MHQLEIVDGRFSGQVAGPIVGAERKREILVTTAQRMDLDLAQTVAVGDGANDLLMMDKAGLGIAFNAKPSVQAKVLLGLFYY